MITRRAFLQISAAATAGLAAAPWLSQAPAAAQMQPVAACGMSVPMAVPLEILESCPAGEATATDTLVPTMTASLTATLTATATQTLTATPTETATPKPTGTATATNSPAPEPELIYLPVIMED